MRLLLDTHVFLWWATESARLSPRMLALCEDEGNTLLLSVVSAWEIQIKSQLGKLRLARPLPDLVSHQQNANNLIVLPITLEHVSALDGLPLHHRDPFDRLLIAQTLVEEAILLSVDKAFAAYSLRVIR
jgi:PIN domain nuclease of toxin-antitoxin system